MSLTDTSFTTTFTTVHTPLEAFDAINNVRAWWDGEIDGESHKLGDVFSYRYGEIHRSTQRVTESVPGERVVWHVDEAFLNFTSDPAEWVGTSIVFDITTTDDGATEVRFTHRGLLPTVECFDICSTTWGHLIGESLRKSIAAPAV